MKRTSLETIRTIFQAKGQVLVGYSQHTEMDYQGGQAA